MKHKLVSENDQAFTIAHPDGSQFQVAKNGLSSHLINKIRGMEPLKKLSGGGYSTPDEIPQEQVASEMPAAPQPDTADSIASDAMSAPVRPEYAKLVDYYKGLGVGGLGGSPESRAQESLARMDELASANPGSLSNMELAKMRELQGITNPAPVADATRIPAAQSAPAPVAPEAQQPIAAMPVQTQAQKAATDPYADYFSGIKDATKQSFGAQDQAARAMAKANQDYLEANKKAEEQFAKDRQTIDAEQEQLKKDVASNKIDPQRLWANMGTGAKIQASIGIILGGIGQGMMGSNTNAALEVVNKAIDRDISSQLENLQTKKGLLAANMEKYRDIRAALTATKMQLNASLQAQIGVAAAQSQSSQAQANAKIALGQLGLQEMQLKNQMAALGLKSQSLGSSGGEAGVPANSDADRAQIMTDPEYQKHRVVVNGRAVRAADPDAAKKQREIEAHAGPVMNMVRELEEMGPSAAIPGSELYQKAQAIRSKLATEIPQLSGLGRLNETEIHQALEMIKDPTSLKQLVNGGARNSAFFKILEDEIESSRQQNILGYKGIKRFNLSKPVGK